MKETSSLVSKAKEKFVILSQKFRLVLRLITGSNTNYPCRDLDTQVPQDGYWKYSYLWTNTTSWISFLASLTHYLEHEKLATKEEVETLLGLVQDNCHNIKLDIEEYLIGLTHLSNELVILK